MNREKSGMQLQQALRCVLPGVLCAAVALGCQRAPELAEVTGRVTLDGEPLAGARVTFTPTDGPQSYAETDAEGRFEMRYSDDRPGAVLGEHRIAVETYRVGRDAAGEMIEFPETLPARYNTETELTREVRAGRQVIDLSLTK